MRCGMTLRANARGRVLLPAGLLVVLFVVARSTGDAQTPAAVPTGPTACPGQPMTVQATGVYTPKPVPERSGKPACVRTGTATSAARS